MAEVVIRIRANGKVELEAVGFTGSSCLAATAPFERALGRAEQRTLKPEFSEQAQAGPARERATE